MNYREVGVAAETGTAAARAVTSGKMNELVGAFNFVAENDYSLNVVDNLYSDASGKKYSATKIESTNPIPENTNFLAPVSVVRAKLEVDLTAIAKGQSFSVPENCELMDSTPLAEDNIIGPDYFGFYTHALAEFLSGEEDYVPFLPQNSNFEGESSLTKNYCTSTEKCNVTNATPLFSNAFGAQVSDFWKERLRSLVSQSLFVFTKEVDEILNPVYQICRVQSLLKHKKSISKLPGETSEYNDEHAQKKQKVSAFSSTVSGARGMELRPENGSRPATESNSGANIETFNVKEIDHDLLFLLENDPTKVEEMTKKHADELFAMISHMEQKLEEFLDILMSKCRLMTLAEKQRLRNLIQDLPPENLDRVVEIIQRNKPIGRYSSHEIYVDLEKENKVTLWRLYYYLDAIENARRRNEA